MMGLWMSIGVLTSRGGLVGMAVTGGLFALFFIVLRSKARSRLFKLWHGSGIVISPSGLGLSQGTHLGILRWKDLLSVEKKTGQTFLTRSAEECLVVKVKGAELTIHNVYAQSLEAIGNSIQRNLGPDQGRQGQI